MENENDNASPVERTPETIIADVQEAVGLLIALVRQLEQRTDTLNQRVDGHDELIQLQHAALKMAGEAIQGHQKILEAKEPEPPTGPPPIVH